MIIKGKKTKIKELCRSILNHYMIGQTISEETHINFLNKLFSLHPNWMKKKGCGIKSIYIDNDRYGHRCFYIRRIDNTYTDISYLSCINPPSKLNDIKKACRNAILPIVNNYKYQIKFNNDRCPITNEILTVNNVDIDHYDMTFDEMFKMWISDKNIDHLYSMVNDSYDNDTTTRFIDINIVDEFISFHNKHCKLRAVTINANRSILRKSKQNIYY